MWISKGKVVWTEDTAHCRLNIGFEVENTKRIARESLGHHQLTVYGDYQDNIELMCDFLGMENKML